MTTQTFLSKLTPGLFSDVTLQQVHTIIGSATEITPELAAQLTACLEREIDDSLKNVVLEPETEAALDLELTIELAAAEEEAQKANELVENNLSTLQDMSKKVDVLERLHT